MTNQEKDMFKQAISRFTAEIENQKQSVDEIKESLEEVAKIEPPENSPQFPQYTGVLDLISNRIDLQLDTLYSIEQYIEELARLLLGSVPQIKELNLDEMPEDRIGKLLYMLDFLSAKLTRANNLLEAIAKELK